MTGNSDITYQDQGLIDWELKQLVKSGLYPDEKTAIE
jgi:hypothetical protein